MAKKKSGWLQAAGGEVMSLTAAIHQTVLLKKRGIDTIRKVKHAQLSKQHGVPLYTIEYKDT